jgi:hypothetical protein
MIYAYVVFRPSRQDPDGTADFIVSANDWINIALSGLFCEVDCESLKSLVLFFGILGIDSCRTSSLLHSCLKCFWSDASFFECFFEDRIFDECCNYMILCYVGILLTLLNRLRSTKKLEGRRAK